MGKEVKCQECGSERIYTAVGHGKDSNSVSYMGRTQDGYLPYITNLGGGDDLEVSVCLDCGQAQGEWPVEGPESEWDSCPECGLAIPTDIDLNEEYVCPDCTYIIIEGPPNWKKEYAPRKHGGFTEVNVPTKKCRLLVPIDLSIGSWSIGHEFFIEAETEDSFFVSLASQRVALRKGIDAE